MTTGTPSGSKKSGVAIRLEDFTLAYRSKGAEPSFLFEPLELSVDPSQIVAVLGPSGCGKTSLLKAVAGLLGAREAVSRGRILLDGQPQADVLPRLETGFVFQRGYLFPWQTVRQNVGLARRLRPGGLDKRAIDGQVDQLLASANLTPHGGKYPGELSGGMYQRVALIREFLKTPDLLLMDEPFGQLDRSNRNQMGAEVLTLWERCKPTILLVTHDPEDAVFLADAVFVFGVSARQRPSYMRVPYGRPREQEIRRDSGFQNMIGQILRCITG